jgi:hypothetical protein
MRSWKVRIEFDGNRECETEISILEGSNIVVQARRINLRPGVNEIDIRPAENYGFRGREHCFKVQVDLKGREEKSTPRVGSASIRGLLGQCTNRVTAVAGSSKTARLLTVLRE